MMEKAILFWVKNQSVTDYKAINILFYCKVHIILQMLNLFVFE